MKIKKMYQGTVPENKILDTYSTSATDTYSCNYVNGLVTYSTDEIRVGTWIDGKPIYRKVASFTATSDNAQSLTIPVQNVNMIIEGRFILKGSDFCAVDHTYILSTSNEIGKWVFTIHEADVSVTISKTIQNTGTYYIILEYTKTTD